MERRTLLVPYLRTLEVVDEAIDIEEGLLGSDLVSHFMAKDFPLRSGKHGDGQRILILSKRTY
jgi:hypothetical protein